MWERNSDVFDGKDFFMHQKLPSHQIQNSHGYIKSLNVLSVNIFVKYLEATRICVCYISCDIYIVLHIIMC